VQPDAHAGANALPARALLSIVTEWSHNSGHRRRSSSQPFCLRSRFFVPFPGCGASCPARRARGRMRQRRGARGWRVLCDTFPTKRSASAHVRHRARAWRH
jgi:hypothetical protein